MVVVFEKSPTSALYINHRNMYQHTHTSSFRKSVSTMLPVPTSTSFDIKTATKLNAHPLHLPPLETGPSSIWYPKAAQGPIEVAPHCKLCDWHHRSFLKMDESPNEKLLPFIYTYVQDSQHVLDLCADLGHLPSNDRLVTVNVAAVYTNSDPEASIQAIIDFITTVSDRLPSNFPSQLVV
jgi:hypothetical protein